MRTFLSGLIGALAVLTAAIGLCWFVANFTSIPEYGDTPEYIALSKTLTVDQYRGIAYPALLRVASATGDFVGVRFTTVLYLFQVAVLFGSSYAFARVILGRLVGGADLKRARSYIALTAAMTVLNPLCMHFALTVLTDSLASSLTVLLLTFLVLATEEGIGNRRCGGWGLCAAVVAVILSAMRVEKLYLAALLFVAAGVMVTVRRFRLERRVYAPKALILALLLCFTLGTSEGVKRMTTVNNPDRPALGIMNSAFNRVVWSRLAKTRQYLPPQIKAMISEKEAADFDTINNNVLPFEAEAINNPKKGQGYLRVITQVAFRHFYGQVILVTVFDTVKYALPGLFFPLEAVHLSPQSFATRWTLIQWSRATPRLTAVYLAVGSGLYLVLFGMSIGRLRLKARPARGVVEAWVLIWVCILGNALMFALAFGMEAHIRYALPTYTITFECVLLLALARHLRRRVAVVTDGHAASRSPINV